MTLIGRKKEIHDLDRYMESGKAEFIAIYGRRRVGKTFLVDTYFNYSYAFFSSGLIGGRRKDEMTAFFLSLKNAGFEGNKPKTWMEAFNALKEVLETKRQEGKRRVIFLDELPCFATPSSGFVKALDWFWNSWASKQPDVFMVVCGSATSWIVNNIINNKGGLHNRITHEIHLDPFNLAETAAYLEAEGFVWDEISIVQTYMVLGGIPYYLSLLKPDLSISQNIDSLFFAPKAELKMEYDRLYKSLFKNPEKYMAIIDLLAVNSKSGMTRKEIVASLGKESGGHLSEHLEDLVNCDFIRHYNVKDKKISRTNGIYQLVDFYSIFYHEFGKIATTDSSYWTKLIKSHRQSTWWGLAYERLCMAHIPQILSAIGVEAVHTEYYSWRSKPKEAGDKNKNAQIDLIIERDDRIVNLCEIKYTSSEEYELDGEERLKIANRIARFKKDTGTKYGIIPTLITTYGLKKNKHSSFFPRTVSMFDLMK